MPKVPRFRKRQLRCGLEIFNAMFIPVLLIFPTLILEEEAVEKMFWIVLIGAQAGLFVFDKAYMYFQIFIWGKLRSKVMK